MKFTMTSLRILLKHSKPSNLFQSSPNLISHGLHVHSSVVSLNKSHRYYRSMFSIEPFPVYSQHSSMIPLSSSFHVSNKHRQSQPQSQPDKDKLAALCSQMNMRLLNENSFLSWCRNAYLSSVVGIAMLEEATSSLGQTAGFGAFLVGGMNLFWGTGCHMINLVRLRHASGMSWLTLTLNILGSGVHCLLWLFILTCYIGFLDESSEYRSNKKKKKTETDE